jgi:hypothetical protein
MSFYASNGIKNAYDMLIIRIEYIFIKFLHFMSYKSLE